MMRSLFAGVSGLRNNQVRMDVIGNNVANANTLGFKSGRVTFQEGYAQVLQSASRPQAGVGGINAKQVGTGMRVASIDTLFSQGSFESTGISTDLAIQGDSFFTVSDGSNRFFTRAGNFQLDSTGRLVSPGNGYVLQGRMATAGKLGGALTDIRIPFDQKAPAQATTRASMGGNLDASAAAWSPTNPADTPLTAPAADLEANEGSWSETSITAYDSLGNKHDLKLVMWKQDDTTWNWSVDFGKLDLLPSPPAPAPAGSGTFTFDSTGQLTASTGSPITFSPAGGASPVSVILDPGKGVSGLTQFAGKNSAVLREQDGYAMGNLADFGIDQSGIITGSFDNGTTMILAQVALADFNNPGGLTKVGNNMFTTSSNSGDPVVGYSGEGTTSTIASSSLEMSNVDLAGEFTQMIIAQRAFAAAGRTITAADEMLQEVVNLKR